MTDLVLLTAGPDSVFALDYALKRTAEPVLAVHVYTGTPIAKLERPRVEKIVGYMRQTRRHFDYQMMTLSFAPGYQPHHNVLTGWAVAAAQMARGDIRRVYRGDCIEEVADVKEGRDGFGVKGDLVFDHVVGALLMTPGIEKWAKGSEMPETCLPGHSLSKIEYTAGFEPALRRLLMSCMNPQTNGAGGYSPCGVCIKCDYMKGILT